MIRVADYIMKTLADRGVTEIFLVTGGGAMFLNDAVAKEKRLKPVCNHHEQACAMAAEGYARIKGEIGVINVTTGPGGINALNGVYGAWTDSIPMLVLSGQVKRETYVRTFKNLKNLRQLGDQEADIVGMVKGITKYAVTVDKPEEIRYHLEKALFLATTGRQGPVWLDIPIDVQSSLIEEEKIKGFEQEPKAAVKLETVCDGVVERLNKAKRPVILAGSGIRLAQAESVFEKVIRKLGIPVTTAWTAIDLLDSNDPLYCGRPGSVGNRAGNFTVQNADFVLIIGTRLSIRQVSYNAKSFARGAYKVYVDIDKEEFKKPYIKLDENIQADAKEFLEQLEKSLSKVEYDAKKYSEWLNWCKKRVAKYAGNIEKSQDGKNLNPYYFFKELFTQLPKNSVVACANGAASVMPFQVGDIKKGQRVFTNAGSASLGYELPAAIGAAFARPKNEIVCLGGDGSIQFNLQELQTIIEHRLPIKIFVIDNGGYLSIKTTQTSFFDGRLIGEGPESGLSFPDLIKVGKAYGFSTYSVSKTNIDIELKKILSDKKPLIAVVKVDSKQPIEPKVSSKRLPDGKMVSSPLEDMAPFLDRDEFKSNMFVETIDE
jgi:acetolactate synthase-1/2/3 large subunit